MRNRRVSENASRTPGESGEARVNLIRGCPTTTLPKSSVTPGTSTGATGAGQTSLTRVNAPRGVSWTPVTVMRTRSVVTGVANGTGHWMTSLSRTVAAVCHAPSRHTSTVKSVGTPSLLDSTVIPGSSAGPGRVMVSVSGKAPSVSSFQKVSGSPSTVWAAS